MPGISAEETQGYMREVSTPILVQIAEANLGNCDGWQRLGLNYHGLMCILEYHIGNIKIPKNNKQQQQQTTCYLPKSNCAKFENTLAK